MYLKRISIGWNIASYLSRLDLGDINNRYKKGRSRARYIMALKINQEDTKLDCYLFTISSNNACFILSQQFLVSFART